MAFIGMAPFGSLLSGYLAEHIGAPHTVLISGILSFIIMLFFAKKLPAIRMLVHPIYARKGIIPEVAAGLQTAERFSAEAKE
jgi:hypothetical protein